MGQALHGVVRTHAVDLSFHQSDTHLAKPISNDPTPLPLLVTDTVTTPASTSTSGSVTVSQAELSIDELNGGAPHPQHKRVKEQQTPEQ